MSVNQRTKTILAFRSGGICAFPGCSQQLTVNDSQKADPAILGEAAHICGEEPKSSRYEQSMTDKERNSYSNLVYLCPNHHTIIDAQPNNYPVEKVREFKVSHESKVQNLMLEGMASVSFKELEYATKAFMSITPLSFSADFTLVAPEDKIRKNELTDRSLLVIKTGLSLSKEISDFIDIVAQEDTNFPERLKAGFLEEYFRLRKESISGDELFDMMCQFSQRGQKDQCGKSAGLAILVYLFEKCEVFEK
jgi:hypothetical protein